MERYRCQLCRQAFPASAMNQLPCCGAVVCRRHYDNPRDPICRIMPTNKCLVCQAPRRGGAPRKLAEQICAHLETVARHCALAAEKIRQAALLT